MSNMSNKGSKPQDQTTHSIGVEVMSTPKNAQEVMANGDHYIYGIGNYDGTNYSSTQTLYEVVEGHDGTLEDPIPYNEELDPFWQGMILEEGKYYTQSSVVYKCIRGTGNKVVQNLADLVSGGFVQVVE